MTPRGITYADAMVLALLRGRKTQTRLPVSGLTPGGHVQELRDGTWEHSRDGGFDHDVIPVKNPYGLPGDHLYVKEAWGVVSHAFDEDGNITPWTPDRPAKPISDAPYAGGYYSGHVIYRADGEFQWNAGDDPSMDTAPLWKTSVPMPRWASRLTLEIQSVKIERLCAIVDAEPEGIYERSAIGDDPASATWTWQRRGWRYNHPREAYAVLWDLTHGHKPGLAWKDDPWVWVIKHKLITT